MNQAELNLSYFMESARKELERQQVAKNIADEIKRQQEVYERGVQAMLLASNQESQWNQDVRIVLWYCVLGKLTPAITMNYLMKSALTAYWLLLPKMLYLYP